MRRARFPVEQFEGESIPGVLARGIRRNVLERSTIAFFDAGIVPRKAGLTQVMPEAELRRLAAFTGASADDLIRQSGVLNNDTAGFGDLVLPRGDIEFERRRIAPRTLRGSPFHRSAWMMRLLPYCPESLERLVDTCPDCSVALAWSRCWGIGICEWCRQPVPPSPEARLPDRHSHDYRLFAGLLSLTEAERRQALTSLPDRLHQMEPGVLVHMAIRLGQACRPEPVGGVRRESVYKLPAPQLAGIATLGTAMLRDWPSSFIDWSASALSEHLNDLGRYHVVRQSIRRLGDVRFEHPAQAALVREAVPSEFANFVRSAPGADFLTGADMMKITYLRNRQVRLIRDGLEERRLPGVKRVRSQYHPARSQAFFEKYRNSTTIDHLTFRLMLPTYAVEQLICDDALDREGDELVERARGGACVTAGALDSLIERLRRRSSMSALHPSALPLRVAAQRIGGRLKPWGAIFRDLLDGRLQFWIVGDAVQSRTIFVLAASLAPYQSRVFRADKHPDFPFSAMCAKIEAEEILNMSPRYLNRYADAGSIAFQPVGRRLAASIDDVVHLAAQMVSFAELSAHTGWTYGDARSATRSLGLTKLGTSWSREEVTRLQLVPPLPTLSLEPDALLTDPLRSKIRQSTRSILADH